ncbi:MAG: hypothetical protein ACI94O_001244, partial [Octadecabacter sp.]
FRWLTTNASYMLACFAFFGDHFDIFMRLKLYKMTL